MTHKPSSCDLLHDSLDDVSDLVEVTPALAEVLDLLDLNPNGLAWVRLSRTEQRRVDRVRDRLAGIPAPRPST